MAQPKTCCVCGKPCTDEDCLSGARQLYFHRRCCEEILRRLPATGADRQRTATPGDVLQCTNGACGRKFSATRALSLGPPRRNSVSRLWQPHDSSARGRATKS